MGINIIFGGNAPLVVGRVYSSWVNITDQQVTLCHSQRPEESGHSLLAPLAAGFWVTSALVSGFGGFESGERMRDPSRRKQTGHMQETQRHKPWESRSPSSALLPFLFRGRVPLLKQTTEEKGNCPSTGWPRNED